MDVPLREETLPIHGIRILFGNTTPERVHLEPGGEALKLRREGERAWVEVPRLEMRAIVVGE
ncbi:MAG: hypothetical protein U0793_14445 [Gemmataceae bacterium]